jgi:hypothetical protein
MFYDEKTVVGLISASTVISIWSVGRDYTEMDTLAA